MSGINYRDRHHYDEVWAGSGTDVLLIGIGIAIVVLVTHIAIDQTAGPACKEAGFHGMLGLYQCLATGLMHATGH